MSDSGDKRTRRSVQLSWQRDDAPVGRIDEVHRGGRICPGTLFQGRQRPIFGMERFVEMFDYRRQDETTLQADGLAAIHDLPPAIQREGHFATIGAGTARGSPLGQQFCLRLRAKATGRIPGMAAYRSDHTLFISGLLKPSAS